MVRNTYDKNRQKVITIFEDNNQRVSSTQEILKENIEIKTTAITLKEKNKILFEKLICFIRRFWA